MTKRNPIAKALRHLRPKIKPGKKGKGSYDRRKGKQIDG